MNKFQISGWILADMCKCIILVTNSHKQSSAGGWERPFTFDFGDLKLRDLAKLWFFKQIMTKSYFKRIIYDVILVTSSLLRH